MAIGTSKVGALGGLVPGGTVTFNASGTFCVPPGVKKVSIEGVGGTGNPGNPGNPGNAGNPGSGGAGGGGGSGFGKSSPGSPNLAVPCGQQGGYALRTTSVNIAANNLSCGQPWPAYPCTYVAKSGLGAYNPQNPVQSRTGSSGQSGSAGSGGSAGSAGSAGNPGQASSGLGNTFPGGAGGAAGNAGNAGSAGNGGTGGSGGNGPNGVPSPSVSPYVNNTIAGGNGGSGGNAGGAGGPGTNNKAFTINPSSPFFRSGGSGGGGAGINGSGGPGAVGVTPGANFFGCNNINPANPRFPISATGINAGAGQGGTGCFPWPQVRINVCPPRTLPNVGIWGWGGPGSLGNGWNCSKNAATMAYPAPNGTWPGFMGTTTHYGWPNCIYNPGYNKSVQFGPQVGTNIPNAGYFRVGAGGGSGGLSYQFEIQPTPTNPLLGGGGGGGGGGGRGNAGGAGGTGGAGGCGAAGTPTTFNCVSVTPGCSYPITVACGGSVTISWNPQ